MRKIWLILIIGMFLFSSVAAKDFIIRNETSQLPYFVVNGTSGFTGIGTITPSEQLHVENRAIIGNLDLATSASLIVKGGVSGAPIVRLERTGFYADWSLTGGGLMFNIGGQNSLNLYGDATDASAYLGQKSINNQAYIRNSILSATTINPSITDGSSTGNLILRGGLGTGAGNSGDILLQTGTTGTTGTAVHTGTSRIAIKANSGYVGIGTTNPGAKLEVDSGTTSFLVKEDLLNGFHGAEITGTNAALKLTSGSNEQYYLTALSDNSLRIYDGTGNSGYRLTIDENGSVGIGTTSPSTGLKLDVEGKVGATQYCDENGLNCVDIGTVGTVNGSGTNNYLAKFDASGIGVQDSVIYDDGTNVGIGNNNPGSKLEIFDVTVDQAEYKFTESSTSGYSTRFNMDNVGLDIGHDSVSRSLNLKTGNQDRLTIEGTGDVGINNTAPEATLHVTGDVIIEL